MSLEKTCVVWHAHHDCNSPLEFLTESYESRLETINTVKAALETPDKIQLRLKLFKRVTGELLASIVKALEAWGAARDVAWEAAREAGEAWEVVLEAQKAMWEAEQEAWEVVLEAQEDILKLHSAQCGCGWTREHPNIFDYGLK